MRKPTLLLSLLVFALLAMAPAARASERPVWRLDSVIATALKGGGIQVQVKGAVKSGGWTQVRLRQVKSSNDTVVLELVATPPAANAVVIQALLPVSAQVTVKAGSGVTSVRVEADANDITAQVLR